MRSSLGRRRQHFGSTATDNDTRECAYLAHGQVISRSVMCAENMAEHSFIGGGKRSIEKAARLQRKRLRSQKREKLRRERKSRHTLLKKTLRDAKAIQKAAAAAGSVVVVDKQLKKQWKAEQEADTRRREEKARKRVEHEARKEARRVKREKKRGRKRRDPNKAAKKGQGPTTTTTSEDTDRTGRPKTGKPSIAQDRPWWPVLDART
ncbi:hypothetical protein ANCCEY_00879 [Ancylostoma ceylanicum]|uniref:Uncharacterized protein n=1 Tax=Ancylostoma ceylanicum TaxID=53326 RepID=A0A0D6MB57_9BILA|nr:hypothetical protein ANCCEY_00879 [Ancylostoma ceylanicum]